MQIVMQNLFETLLLFPLWKRMVFLGQSYIQKMSEQMAFVTFVSSVCVSVFLPGCLPMIVCLCRSMCSSLLPGSLFAYPYLSVCLYMFGCLSFSWCCITLCVHLFVPLTLPLTFHVWMCMVLVLFVHRAKRKCWLSRW